jgi:hypothetical protein
MAAVMTDMSDFRIVNRIPGFLPAATASKAPSGHKNSLFRASWAQN